MKENTFIFQILVIVGNSDVLMLCLSHPFLNVEQ